MSTRSATAGDTAQMLADRAALLDSGAYAPVVDALLDALPRDTSRIVDAGCGTGYYLARALESRTAASGLALDRSAAGVRLAMRSSDRVSGLVADTWEPLPIRDSIADVVLNVFAPRNPGEFNRILRPGGSLIIIVPRDRHLRELREGARMLSVPADKAEHLEQQLAAQFSADSRVTVEYSLPLAAGQAELLREMGPSAYHPTLCDESVHENEAASGWMPPQSVTVSVDVLRFTRPLPASNQRLEPTG
nr:methyltransferase domain-containing protein [Glaciibacter superstes]